MKALILFTTVLAPYVLAQEYTLPPSVPFVRVHGESTVSAQPDRAQLDIGVTTQDSTVQGATDLNAKQSNTVVSELRALVPSTNIKTVNFSVNPNYRYPQGGGSPTILGYTANNTVRVQIDDLSKLQKVIDIATKSGANNVNRLNFMLRDEEKARAEALAKAAELARSGAQSLAAALNERIGHILRVEEGQPVVISPGRQVEISMAKSQSSQQTPVEPGNIEIHASVNVTFELLH
jgi:uncharacterized protein YggE